MNRTPALPFNGRNVFKVWNRAEEVFRQSVKTALSFNPASDVLSESQSRKRTVIHAAPVDHFLQVQKQRLSLFCHLIFDASFDGSAPPFRPCKRLIFFTPFGSCFK
jgi:hypothetical protein